jgi:hypothetical protein
MLIKLACNFIQLLLRKIWKRVSEIGNYYLRPIPQKQKYNRMNQVTQKSHNKPG